ncbi:MAG: hypothetical protein CMM60_03675 [Rhodospirillaceae bacterium]|jgi:hypothetical protein|nr:hypothetical protein [Rhodospirillaceae bacterium]|tara:strand:+ start:1476 stop:1973 length:498 start_codon:yes stop_codon:yes gene_type:complete
MDSPANRQSQIDEIRRLIAVEQSPDFKNAPVLAQRELQLRKWRLIHKHLHSHPFPTKTRLSRGEQWRDAINYIRDLGEMEILDWMLLQAEVAYNIENGIHDLRPRKNGPCHDLLMEYVNNRKRKALAVYKWVVAASEGNTATDKTLTPAILKLHSTKGTGGTENL